ncbi:MAG: carbamate kinase [Gammaproteobacteria bacterium]
MTVDPLAVVAIGGNALIRDHQHRSIPDQYQAAIAMARSLAEMISAGWNLVVTHGNGPQMGFILRRSELAVPEVAPMPMDYAVADSQGVIGYMFLKALRNEFHERGMRRQPIAIVTQTLVSPDDPAFAQPSKPIGAHMDEATARQRAAEHGWIVKEDAGRGWRRVVPSPRPQAILELDTIRTLVAAGYVVIAGGGGGIPVARDGAGRIQGVEAVIDKDFASGLLARALGAELLLISTAVERVAVQFNKPDQRWLERMTVADAKRYQSEEQFDKGSMGPKVQALIEFVEASGKSGLITSIAGIGRALAGATGTWIVPG